LLPNETMQAHLGSPSARSTSSTTVARADAVRRLSMSLLADTDSHAENNV
jgi:hypothetical protein